MRIFETTVKMLRDAIILLIAGVLIFNAQAQDSSRTVSFSFSEQDAESVFVALGRMYSVAFRSSAPVNELLTLDSRGQVALAEAVVILDEALAPYGHSARYEDGIVKITPRSGLLATDIEVIVLKHSDPASVAEVVVELFQSRDIITELAAKDPKFLEQLLPQLAKSPRTGGESLKVDATPWPPLHAVIVKAPKQVMPLIRRFILESIDAAEGEVQAAKAKREAEQRKREAEAKKKADEARKKKEEEERQKKANQPPPPPEVTKTFQPRFVEAKHISDYCKRLKKISPTILPNNVLMFTTRKYEEFDDIQYVLDMLDIPDTTSFQQYYIPLKHAKAEDVRKLLDQLFRYRLEDPVTGEGAEEIARQRQGRRGRRSRRDGNGDDQQANQELPDSLEGDFTPDPEPADDALAEDVQQLGIPVGEINIVTDVRNNAIVIRTLPANIESIRNIIERIDVPSGQVLIEVFIAEVKLDDRMELGVDFFNNGPTGNLPGKSIAEYFLTQNFEVGDMGAANDITGLSYVISSNNYGMLLRAFQNTQNLDVVSRPSITTLDNNPAVFEFGGQVPLVQASNVSVQGTVISTVVRYERIGHKLTVTPHINEAGFVTLEIEQNIDDVSQETFKINEQLEPFQLIKRMAKTKLRVFNGQTVFLGGFIDDQTNAIETKVPFLGDIPLLGYLFRSSQDVRIKTELLIFITPHIVSVPEELKRQSDRVRLRSQMLRNGGNIPEELQVVKPKTVAKTEKPKARLEVKEDKKSEASEKASPEPDKKTGTAGAEKADDDKKTQSDKKDKPVSHDDAEKTGPEKSETSKDDKKPEKDSKDNT